MNLSCGSKTIKYLIFSFNFFFVITGIILIAVGASIRTYFIQYDYFLDNKYFSLPNLLIVTGSFVFVICFLGCYGAMKNSWIMLLLFSVLLTMIFIFEFSAGIAGYVLRDKTSSYLETTMKNSLQQYYDKEHAATGIWDFIQPKFECCGVTDYQDWLPFNNGSSDSLPMSCCKLKPGQWGNATCSANSTPSTSTSTTTPTTNSTMSTTNSTTVATTTASINDTTPVPTTMKSVQKRQASAGGVNTNQSVDSSAPHYWLGCEEAFGTWVKAHAVDIGAVCFTLAVLQLIGIGFACHLSKQLKNSYYST